MVYVALLRGVNVGRAGKVDMQVLKATVEAAGMKGVRTYINSGNVIFESETGDRLALQSLLERAIEERFGFAVRVLVRDLEEIRSVVSALPDDWRNDDEYKCDVLFLWDEADRSSVLDELEWDERIEDVRYTAGAVIRRIGREHASKSKLTRIVGTPLYQSVTIRNCNTARRLLDLMEI